MRKLRWTAPTVSQIRRGGTTRGASAAVRWACALALSLAIALPAGPRPALAQADPCPEPNDTFAGACFVGPGTPTVRGFITQAGDVDAYKFEVNDPLARVRVELADLPADYDLHLFDTNAAVLAESTNQGTVPDTIDLLMIRGTYFVFVNAPRGQFSPGQPYRLSINVAAVAEPLPGSVFTPCPEPNDTFEQACPIASGKLAFGLLGGPGDVDVFGLDVAEAGSLVNAKLGEVPDDFTFELLDAAGAVLDRGVYDVQLSTRVGPGRYFVRVRRAGGDGSPAPYPLLVTATPPAVAPAATRPDACPEPNDGYDQACPIGPDGPAFGYIATPSDLDMYTFEVSGGRAWVHVELTDLPADYKVEVQDASHAFVQSSDNAGTFPEALDLDLDPGRYFILVYSALAQSKSDQPYRLGLSMVPLDGASRPSGTVLFADNFNVPGAHFAATAAEDSYEVGYYDGEYVVKLHQPGRPDSIENAGQVANADLKDFQLELDARMTVPAQRAGGFDVSFRWQDADNQYELYVDTVSRPGAAGLSRWSNGKLKDLTPWVPSAAIRTGSQSNHVTIRADGTRLAVAINGQAVLEVTDDTFAVGNIGLGAWSGDQPTEARFDNVLVTPIR